MNKYENEFDTFLDEYKNLNNQDKYMINASIIKNTRINDILSKHNFNNADVLKIEKFICILSRYKIDKIVKFNRIDNEIFDFVKRYKEYNLKYLYALVINCLLGKISYQELKKFNQFIESKEQFYIIDYFIHDDKNGKYIYSHDLKFFDNMDFIIKNTPLPENIPHKYYLNLDGNKFIDNIYLDVTPKMKEYYSNLIDKNIMEKNQHLKQHYNYYHKILEEISKDTTAIKVARLHDRIFKDFFEEYKVLILYAYKRYGYNCKIEWCGMKTQKNNSSKLKYDGIIENNHKREFVEICSPQYDEQNKNIMKELNDRGVSFNSNIQSWDELILKIKDSVSKKNKKTKLYNEQINLVIEVYLQDIDEENYDDIVNIDKKFDKLKSINYLFGNVYILIEKIIVDGKEINPRIIKIK